MSDFKKLGNVRSKYIIVHNTTPINLIFYPIADVTRPKL